MKKLTLLSMYTLITVYLLCSSARSYADDQPLRGEFEKVYRKYILAHESGSIEAIKGVRSSFAFVTMMNNYFDSRRTLTSEDIKNMANTSPDIFKMKFLRTLIKGPTAGLLYVHDSDFIDASKKPRVEFAVVKFIQEPSGWKVDMIATFGQLKYDAEGKETEFDEKMLSESIAIDGKVRKAPELRAPPFAAGDLDIDSYGYETIVLINAVEQLHAIDKSASKLIAGGLKKGQNEVEIVYKTLNNETPFKPSVTIRRIFDENDIKEIFKHKPVRDIEGKHRFTIWVEE